MKLSLRLISGARPRSVNAMPVLAVVTFAATAMLLPPGGAVDFLQFYGIATLGIGAFWLWGSDLVRFVLTLVLVLAIGVLIHGLFINPPARPPVPGMPLRAASTRVFVLGSLLLMWLPATERWVANRPPRTAPNRSAPNPPAVNGDGTMTDRR